MSKTKVEGEAAGLGVGSGTDTGTGDTLNSKEHMITNSVIASSERSNASQRKTQRVAMPFFSIYEEGPATDMSVSEIQELPMSAVPPLYPEWESRAGDSVSLLPHNKREQWENQIEYLLVLLSCAVGLGNVWKFPFTAFNNGGGAFLIPYLIIVVIVAFPLYFIELGMGQFCSRGPLGIWDCAPLMRGLGWSCFMVSTMISLFYLVLLSWCALFFFYSFYPELPWTKCDIDMYTSGGIMGVKTGFNDAFPNARCNKTDAHFFIFDGPPFLNETSNKTEFLPINLPTEIPFFAFHVLKANPNIVKYGYGWPQFEMGVALLVLWFLVFLAMLFGTKSTGKVAYFTGLFPYVVLITLFVRAVTLDGAMDGIKKFVTPDFEKLIQIDDKVSVFGVVYSSSIKVWFKAMNQVFFSLGIGIGAALVAGSYNSLHQKAYSDALYISLADTFTSVLAGVTVFSTMGVLAKRQNVPFEEVASSGPGLSFIAYPMLMSSFGEYPIPNIFSALFFAMLLSMGIGSAVSFQHVFTATILDQIPCLGMKREYKIALVGGLTIFSFFFGLFAFTTPAAEHMINLFDVYGCGFIMFFIVTTELAAIAYIYGMKNLERDFQFMCPEFGLKCACKILRYWGYIMPIFMLAVFIYICLTIDLVKETLASGVEAPLYLQIAGWSLVAIVIGIIPAYAVIIILTRRTRSLYKKFMASVTPNKYWGPKVPEEKIVWVHFKKDYNGNTFLWNSIFGNPRPPPDQEYTNEEVPAEEEASVANSADVPEQIESAES